ncbi:DUF748 domain-containing protein [Fulvivirgaceae bacterium PWU5]|uniref:DUF748 domain-containing protein n=1 Tax=Dawidia cretensis TaxID=2782350 RepID=A0AAP2GVI1_9BACT|nr:DUF748 domain-containing protein [Dawidia cretensis]MBT1710535.1 DUF748 domain-containing protein [Dawidia cretensis]
MKTKRVPHGKSRRIWKILLAVVIVLVVVRLILPYVVLRYANKTLANMKGYYGHITDIDLALIRGAYRMDSIYLNQVDTVTQKQTEFFAASAIDLSIEWKALLHGSVVGELVFENPMIRFTKDKVEPTDVRNDSTDFRQLLDDFMPLQVNRFEVNNGRIRYIDQHSSPPVDIAMTNTNILALNLRNSYDSAALLPATVKASADIYEGSLDFNMKINPLADDPTFDMNAEVKNTNLVKLNEFFQAYAKIDVNKGRFGLYTEVAAKEGQFNGYVKPLIQDLDVLGKEDRDDNVFRKMWEAVAGGVGEIFENQRKDQVATKLQFRGDLKNPRTNTWSAIINVLQNAFIQAIQPSIDYEINLASVDSPENKEKKGFLAKAFDSDKSDKDDKSRDEKRAERKKKRDEKKREREERREAKKQEKDSGRAI